MFLNLKDTLKTIKAHTVYPAGHHCDAGSISRDDTRHRQQGCLQKGNGLGTQEGERLTVHPLVPIELRTKCILKETEMAFQRALSP